MILKRVVLPYRALGNVWKFCLFFVGVVKMMEHEIGF